MDWITSRSNPKIKSVRALRRRKNRQKQGLFAVEGIRHVGEALQAGADLDSVYYAPDLLTSEFAQELVESARGRAVPCYATSREVFASLAEKENPQGILAVVRFTSTPLADVSPQNFPWGVALVSPQDPGNVGTILRTIDAVGASGMLLLDESVDPTHPTAVRASMGALFWVPVVRTSFEEFARWVSEQGYHVYGSSARAAVDYHQVRDYPRPRILLLGSERQGLSEAQDAACEISLHLPMLGRATSLNLSVAAGVLLYAMLAADKGEIAPSNG